MSGITLRRFDQQHEDPAGLFALFASCYGDSLPLQRRWQWEYLAHPRKEDVQLLVAEAAGRIVATTSRFPVQVRLDDGVADAGFCINTMVAPEYRRQGIVRSLYRFDRERFPLLISKGTVPEMVRVLELLGNVSLGQVPYQTALLAPCRWLLRKLGWLNGEQRPQIPDPGQLDPQFVPVERFGAEFDRFFARISTQHEGLPVKDSAYMNWRYGVCPQATYRSFYRMLQNEVLAVVVLARKGSGGCLVDFLWDRRAADEPRRSLCFAKHFMALTGAVKLTAWATDPRLRQELQANEFRPRPEVQHFSFNPDAGFRPERLTGGYFVHGDGDVEYLN